MGTQDDFFNEHATGSGYPAFKFDKIGDGVAGTILDTPRPVTGPDKFNPGKEVTSLPVNLDTDGTDAGRRTVWIKAGAMASAVMDAYTTAGVRGLEVGGKLGVVFTEEKDTGKGNPAKLYEAKYEPPAKVTSVDDIFNQ